MKKRNKNKKRNLFNNAYLIKSIKKSDKLLENKNDKKEEISLLDDFVEEKEIDGDLKEEIFKDFESEIKEEELVESSFPFEKNLYDNSAKNYIKDEEFLKKRTAENDKSEPKSNNMFNKGLGYFKSIFKKEDELLDQSINILNNEIVENKKIVNKFSNDNSTNKKELARQNKGSNKRNKRPERIAFHTTKIIKKLLNKLAEREAKVNNKKIYLVDIFEKALAEYQKNHYSNLDINKEGNNENSEYKKSL